MEECGALLLTVSLFVDVEDQWLWTLEPSYGYMFVVLTSQI